MIPLPDSSCKKASVKFVRSLPAGTVTTPSISITCPTKESRSLSRLAIVISSGGSEIVTAILLVESLSPVISSATTE